MINAIKPNDTSPSFKGLMIVSQGTEENISYTKAINSKSIVKVLSFTDNKTGDSGTEIVYGPFQSYTEGEIKQGQKSGLTKVLVAAPLSEVLRCYKEAEKNGIAYLQ